MAVHACPNCGRRGLTWSVDEEVSPFTQWYCPLCDYSASEDESRAVTCNACGAEKMRLLLSDAGASFWFCLACQSRSPADGVA